MAIEAITKIPAPGDKLCTLSRTVGKPGDAVTDTIQVCISTKTGETLTCSVDSLDLLNGIKTVFPELLINLAG